MEPIQIIEFSTFYKIPKVQGYDYRQLLRALSTVNFYTQEYIPNGYFEYETHYRIMKIAKDMLLQYMRYCKIACTIVKSGNFPYDILKGFAMKNQPRDKLQSDVIKDVMEVFKDKERCIVSLQTGRGKTYVATNVISQLKVRAIILVKSVELKKQWIESFQKHSYCKNILSIEEGIDWLDYIESKTYEPDVIIATHKSFYILLQDIGEKAFIEFLLKKKIGMKVFDEFDLENGNMFKFDTISSLRYTLYLSATTYKSSRDDDKAFQRIFKDVDNIGPEYMVEVERNGLFILFNSKPSQKEYWRCHLYTKDGPTFNYQKFHKYAIESKIYDKVLKYLWDKIIKSRYNSEATLKTVFFIGRRDTLAKNFRDNLEKIFDLPKGSISILNSDTPKKEREQIMQKSKLIVSTSKSMGRGIDLKGLDIIVDLETRASKSESAQVIGRVSRVGMTTVGTYIGVVDTAFETVKRNHDNKMNYGFYDEQLTKIKEIEI